MAWIAAIAGGYLSYQGAKESNRANAGKGFVDNTTFNDPWGPSGNARVFGMEEAYRRMMGQEVPKNWSTPTGAVDFSGATGGVPPGPAGNGGGGTLSHGGQASTALPQGKGKKNQPLTRSQQKQLQRQQAGQGGSQQAPQFQFQGMSQETDEIRRAMMQNAQQGNRLYGEGEDWISDTTSGDPSRDRNTYRTETADMLRGFDSPELKRYQDMLFAATEGRGSGGSGARQAALNNARSSGGGGALGASFGGSGNPAAINQAGPVGVQKDLRSILDGNDTPEAQAMRDRITRQADAAYASRARDVRLRSAGSGMFGGSGWQGAEADALSDYSQNVSDALAAQDYQLYSQALGLGTQYDTAALDRAAQERMSSASISASAGSAAADRSSREYLGQLDALGQSVGMGIGLGQYKISGMGSLADSYSGDQQFAIGNTGNITGLGLRDWGAAGDMSLGADSGRTTWAGDRGRERAASSSANLGRAQLDWEKQRYAREAPMRDVANYADILNAFSGSYGTRHEYGYDTRNASPSINAWGQALAGAAGGYSLGQSIQNGNR